MKSVQVARALGKRLRLENVPIRTHSTVHDAPQATVSLGQGPPPPPVGSSTAFDRALNATGPRSDWTKEEISEIHQKPLMELAFAAVRAPLVTITKEFYKTPSSLLLTNSLCSGHSPSSIPQAVFGPALHLNEHQDRRMHGRLLVLRPVIPLFHWPRLHKTFDS